LHEHTHSDHKGVCVFQLSVVDHIRLSFGSVVTAYEGHAEAAARLARWGWYAKVVTMTAVALAAVLSGVALYAGRGFQIAAAVAATAALAACAGYVAFDPQPRIYGHRASAARLWLLCENYRALLAEVHDELLDLSALKERRAELLRDASAVLEHTSPDDRYSYEIARKALKGLGGAGYSDADLDRYLPSSLRKQTNAA
jgi:hypothetical protein